MVNKNPIKFAKKINSVEQLHEEMLKLDRMHKRTEAAFQRARELTVSTKVCAGKGKPCEMIERTEILPLESVFAGKTRKARRALNITSSFIRAQDALTRRYLAAGYRMEDWDMHMANAKAPAP